MKKPFKISIDLYVMANNEEEAIEAADEIIENSAIEQYIDNPVWDDPIELNDCLGAFYSAEEISIDQVNQLFIDQASEE